MRYLLVDIISEVEPLSLIRGAKSLAMSEDFLEWHFPKRPIMPGVLLLEAMVQLAGWLEAVSTDFQSWILLHTVKRCGFYGFILPGDQVDMEVRIIKRDGDKENTYSALGRVKGKKRVAAEFQGMIVPLTYLEDVAEKRRLFEVLTRKGMGF